MERLTRISEITDFYMPIKMQESCGESACKEICEQYEGDCCMGCPVQECITRLAEYEDTGLAPDEIHKLNDFEQSQMATLLKEKAILLKEHFELKKERNYWEREAKKWASELGEQKLERGN